MPAPGDVLNGRYRLDDRIAAGGMGEVWRASDTVLGRPVAVKMLLVERSGEPSFRQRFEHEARAMAALRHPGVAAVYDYGTTGYGAYLVMARIDGQPLDRWIAERGRLSASQTMALVAQVARALQAVHRAGIVHRDVTPGNLIIEPDGNVVLVDFGVARSALSVTLTGARNVIGTASYMAPEQVAKQTVGPAADLYALGAAAYHCLAGRPPFEGGDAVSIALRHVTEEPAPLPADVPAAVRALVTRALSKDPVDRHPSASAMAAAASAAIGGAPARLLATESDTVALTPSAAEAANSTTQGPANNNAAANPTTQDPAHKNATANPTTQDPAHKSGESSATGGSTRSDLWAPFLAVLLAALSGAAAVAVVTDSFSWRDIPAPTVPAPTPPSTSLSATPTPKNTISGTPKKNRPPASPRATRTRTPSASPASSNVASSSGPAASSGGNPGGSEPADGESAGSVNEHAGPVTGSVRPGTAAEGGASGSSQAVRTGD
jgi:serine/threonine-protein kinase